MVPRSWFCAPEEPEDEPFNYAEQGGWDGCTWGGVERCIFLFRETASAAGATHVTHAGNWEGEISLISEHIAYMFEAFAGIVCIQD